MGVGVVLLLVLWYLGWVLNSEDNEIISWNNICGKEDRNVGREPRVSAAITTAVQRITAKTTKKDWLESFFGEVRQVDFWCWLCAPSSVRKTEEGIWCLLLSSTQEHQHTWHLLIFVPHTHTLHYIFTSEFSLYWKAVDEKLGKRNRNISVVQRIDFLKGKTGKLILEVKNQNLVIDCRGKGRVSQLAGWWSLDFLIGRLYGWL